MSADAPTIGQVAYKAALDAAEPQLLALISTAKKSFLSSFGTWVENAHRERLETLFEAAARSKIATLTASTPEKAREQQEIYDAIIDSIETLGLAVEITGKALATAAIKSALHQVLSILAAAAGAAIKAAISVFLPVGGAIVGTIAGAGVEHVLNSFFGTDAPSPPPVAAA